MTDTFDMMSKMTNDQVQIEAASWIAQLDGRKMSSTDRIALSEWISRSPRHANEIRQMAELWGGVDSLLDEIILRQKASPRQNVLGAWLLSRPLHFASTLASVALFSVLTFGAISYYSSQTTVPPNVTVYNVEKGESLTETMSDGSVLKLNTDTVVEVQYSKQARTIRLLRGEALFEVEKDPLRPFKVYAGNSRVEAIGTAFIVRLKDERVGVTVTEGNIRFDQLDIDKNMPVKKLESLQSVKTPVFIAAGQQVVQTGPVQKVAELDDGIIKQKTAWTQGQLVFSGDTLEHVVVEMNRYSPRTIIISDPELLNSRVAGVFQTDNMDPILQALELSMGINVEYARDDLVYLSKN